MPKSPTSSRPSGHTPDDLITIHINRRQFKAWRNRWARRFQRAWQTFLAVLFIVSAVFGILAYFN